MNYRLYSGLIVLCLIICTISCSKKESIPDQIIHEVLNKNVYINTPDSISGSCRYLVFSIVIDDVFKTTALMHLNNENYYCDAHSEVLVQADSKMLKPLAHNTDIDSEGSWIPVNNICLDDFAGKGIKYAGYRIADYSSGEVVYYYGWIGIEVDFNKQNISITERATNFTANRPILTGQTE